MEARKLSESEVTPIQLSLRIRHPSIDPQEISAALELEPEHSFKAGDSREGRAQGQTLRNSQTYWLAPVTPESWRAAAFEPTFLAAIAARHSHYTSAVSADWREAARYLSERNVEFVLLFFLKRLTSRIAFLQRVQNEGGDVAMILLIERDSTADFELPPSAAALLVQLGISLEFRFV